MTSQLDWSSILLDRSSGEPLAGQLAAAIERRIAGGTLPAGTRLPATRDLAASLKINRGTVVAAYRILQNAGLTQGRVGSGTEVRDAGASPVSFDLESLLSSRVADLSPEDSPASSAEL